MSNANLSNNDALVLDQKNITATDKYLANIGQMTIAGTIYTALTLKAVFQADIDATNALAASRAQVKQLVATAKAARAKAKTTRAGLRTYILGTAGASALAMLDDFGMKAPQIPKKSAAVKAEAAEAAAVTRAEKKAPTKKERQAAAKAQALAAATTTPAPTAALAPPASTTPTK
jgi:hypothetical protein